MDAKAAHELSVQNAANLDTVRLRGNLLAQVAVEAGNGNFHLVSYQYNVHNQLVIVVRELRKLGYIVNVASGRLYDGDDGECRITIRW